MLPIGIPADRFVDHGSVTDLRRAIRLDAEGIHAQVTETLARMGIRPGAIPSCPSLRGRRRPRRGATGRAAPSTCQHGGVPTRVRLDQLLTERGLAPTRSRAQALLMSGRVRVGAGDGARLDRKPGDMVDPAIDIELIASAPFVSRGGEKLAGALDAFGVDPPGRVCLDVGASTGGFTDCLLQRGATRVYALDVGRGQLAESLRGDPRVVSMERTHAARLDPDADGPAGAARAGDADRGGRLVHLAHAPAAGHGGRDRARVATSCPWSSPSSS